MGTSQLKLIEAETQVKSTKNNKENGFIISHIKKVNLGTTTAVHPFE
jgi:hypothetical protein